MVVSFPPSVHGDGDHGFVPIFIKLAREKGLAPCGTKPPSTVVLFVPKTFLGILFGTKGKQADNCDVLVRIQFA